MNEPPDEQQLENAIVELRRNYSFGVFCEWLQFVREEAVQTTVSPLYCEKIGALNRGAGNVEALDTILGRIKLVKQTLDKVNKLVSDAVTDEVGGSGPTR